MTWSDKRGKKRNGIAEDAHAWVPMMVHRGARDAWSSVGETSSKTSKPRGETSCVSLSHCHCHATACRYASHSSCACGSGRLDVRFANAIELPATTHMVAIPVELAFQNAH